ncbi:MAG: hypothetical protein K6343_06655 [Caldisericaceae bacterium]
MKKFEKEEEDSFLLNFKKDLRSYHKRRFLADLFVNRKFDEFSLTLLKNKWEIKDVFIKKLIEKETIKKEGNTYVLNISYQNFGTLMQVYIAKYLKEKFGFDYILNVKLRDIKSGGDIDILLKKGLSLFSVEIKESPPNNVTLSELKLILERYMELDPDYFLLIIDTTLSIKRNIVDNFVNLLNTTEQRLREGVVEFFSNFYIITAKRDLFSNIDFVFNRILP